jgi:glycosyltransferase involved in cell wall biosynthesis
MRTVMSATTPTTASPPLHRAPAPGALSGLTVVLPCLDEAENLRDIVALATAAAERYAVTHEIVVVDDGSSDDTAEIAARLASRDSRVRLVVHAAHRGYGRALRSGIAAARLPWVLLIDADLQFDVGELGDFVALAPSADLVVGWRILRQGTVARRAGSALWNRFVRAAFGVRVRDVDCAFRLARRELLRRLDLRASGPLFGTELLVKSAAVGARVVEVPVHHRPRTAGHDVGPGPRLAASTLCELADLRRALHGPRIPGVGV